MCVCFSLDEEPLCYFGVSGMFWRVILKQFTALLLLQVILGAELDRLASLENTWVCKHIMV